MAEIKRIQVKTEYMLRIDEVEFRMITTALRIAGHEPQTGAGWDYSGLCEVLLRGGKQ